MKLSPDQQRGVDAGRAGRNVGFFGSGGVGKTAAVHNLLRKLPSTLILALNGLLALNEGGSTLHGFLWLSHHTEINAANFVKLVKRGTRALQNKRHSHHELVTQGSGTIVLAEISQWSRWQFDLAEEVVRRVSKNPSKLWGGHQVIMSGDFCQHPPVMPGYKDAYACSCIFSDRFSKSFDLVVELTVQHRQSGGASDVAEITVGANREVRNGMLTGQYGPDTMSHIVYRAGVDPVKECLERDAVYLARTRVAVQDFNRSMLKTFPQRFRVTSYTKTGDPESSEFAIDATVMFHVRSTGKHPTLPPYTAVNGTRGTLVGWDGSMTIDNKTPPLARVKVDGTVYTFPMHLHFGNVDTPRKKQTMDRAIAIKPPFAVAFALTIAKCQGLTLEKVVYSSYGISASDLYIIVSRVKNIRNLFPDQNTGTPHPELLKPVDGLAAVTEAFRTLKESKSALHSCEQAR